MVKGAPVIGVHARERYKPGDSSPSFTPVLGSQSKHSHPTPNGILRLRGRKWLPIRPLGGEDFRHTMALLPPKSAILMHAGAQPRSPSHKFLAKPGGRVIR
jgi:hypothetical protein